MIKVLCKEGVWFKEIGYEFLTLARIVYRVYQKHGVTPVVTSACDGKHMKGSWHYEGLAWDWRVWGLKDPKAVWDEIRKEAQAVDFRYDIVFGDEAHLDHAHTEYDLKKIQNSRFKGV